MLGGSAFGKAWNEAKSLGGKDVAWLTVSQYAAAGLGLATNGLAAHVLGPADYGIAALVMSFPTLVWSFAGVKSASVTTRYLAVFRAEGRGRQLRGVVRIGFTVDLALSLVALLIVGLSGWWVAREVYHSPASYSLMLLFAASFPFYSLLGTSFAVYSTSERFLWIATFQIFERALALIMVAGLLFMQMGVAGLVIGVAVSRVVTGVGGIVVATYILHHEGLGYWWRGSSEGISDKYKEIRELFGWNYLTVSLRGLVAQGPVLLLGSLRGPEDAGFYRLATSVVNSVSYLENSLGRVIYPFLSSRIHRETRSRIRSILRRWTLRIGLPTGMVLVFAMPLFAFIIPIVFGADYRPMISGFEMMMLAAAVSGVFFWLIQFYYASGKLRKWTYASIIHAAVMLGLGIAAITQWGFTGMAAIAAAARVVFILAMAQLAWKELEAD